MNVTVQHAVLIQTGGEKRNVARLTQTTKMPSPPHEGMILHFGDRVLPVTLSIEHPISWSFATEEYATFFVIDVFAEASRRQDHVDEEFFFRRLISAGFEIDWIEPEFSHFRDVGK